MGCKKMVKIKQHPSSCYYPSINSRLGKGSGGIAFKVSCYNDDYHDTLFTVPKSQTFVRKKFHNKKHFDYEQYHRNYLRNANPQWLLTYFCKTLRSFSVTINPLDVKTAAAAAAAAPTKKTFYSDFEHLSTPKWKQLWKVPSYEFKSMVNIGQFFKALIRALLDLHNNCNGATYFDVNPSNIFVNYSLWNVKQQIEIKFIDYGGLFHESYKYSFLANPYFLPQPGLSELIREEDQPNLITLVREKNMLPVFYSVICSVSMILDSMQDSLKDFCHFFEVILNGMGKKTGLVEQTQLYGNTQYQAEFIQYLDNNPLAVTSLTR